MGGGGGQGVWRWGEREVIYLSIHCHHQNDSCIKTGSDESHFNVSLIVREEESYTDVWGKGTLRALDSGTFRASLSGTL